MKQIEYNLLEERWVRVRGQDYTVQEVSLPDALGFPCISQEKARFLPFKPIIRDKPCSASLN